MGQGRPYRADPTHKISVFAIAIGVALRHSLDGRRFTSEAYPSFFTTKCDGYRKNRYLMGMGECFYHEK